MSAAITAAAISAGMSFGQMIIQNRRQEQAERDADEAMAVVKGKLDVNFAEQAAIKKESYDSEREALLVQGAMATAAGVESERGAAATSGRVYAGQQKAQAEVRSAQADEMTNIESSILEEESRLRDLTVGVTLEEVAGNAMKASDARSAANQAGQQMAQSVVQGAGEYASQQALYKKDIAAQRAALGQTQNAFNQMSQIGPANLGAAVPLSEMPVALGGQAKPSAAEINVNAMPEGLLGQLKQMSDAEYAKWKKGLSQEEASRYFRNIDYIKEYNAITAPTGI